MRAQLLHSFGDSPDFRPGDIPKPEIEPGQVLIRVAATSVNPVDIKIRRLAPFFAPKLPWVMGMDVAGVVEQAGTGAGHFKPGDEVYGCAGGLLDMPGALAQYMPADARLIAKKPASLTMRQAAALPLVTITAWEALYERADIKPGQNVLVHAGTGGVGHVALQLAKARGARVSATVSSPDKAKLVKSLGAHEAVNYREETVEAYVQRLTGERKGFDVVFDTVGGANLEASFQAARLYGQVTCTNTRASHDLILVHEKALTLHAVFMLLPLIYGQGREHHGAVLRMAAAMVDAGQLTPLIDPAVFGLDDINQAHSFLESGRAVGKVVVDVA